MPSKMKNKKIKNAIYIAVVLLLIGCLLCCELWRDDIFADEDSYLTVTRLIGATVSLSIMLYSGFGNLFKIKLEGLGMAVLAILPCWIIAINNFPIIPVISGRAGISASVGAIALYAFQCLCVGLFEELAFRGCIFSFALDNHRKSTLDMFWAIVISSVVFAAIHLVNILAGASPGAVILQLGYSFLIGGMCSIILIKTKNIWYCVLLHAVYNFAGGVVPECGGGEIWDAPTIILTTVVALIVAAYVIYLLVKITPDEVEALLNDKSKSAQNIDSATV